MPAAPTTSASAAAAPIYSEHGPVYAAHFLSPQRMSSTVRFSRAPSTTGRRLGSGRMEEDAGAALADKALAAFVIIHAMLKRSRRLQTFCERPDIKARFPGYAVRSHILLTP